ncbi:DNA cytosine methyltransferase [Rhizobium pusense]|uniref:DNA (cytosine-5-)-methyltransferase n=1 Tax=Agrobacterium pusense TaxID=648995 RepID=A0A6H0ZKR0_9HYPH|nr:DNA cytosine methyltransferase [Agrobacterium pusense]MDH2091106.1 DNA cytosine methyltransferase [Agrobacterium pusense]QIX21432.1 DNA cytosine methyltransferase [Agrobacterium pusense]
MQHANDNHTGLRFLSVCSGIEAASVAWHPLGWKAVAFSEIEKFPSAVLKYHYPDVPNLGDFTKIDTKTLGRVDILAGGTPCQAFSVAGLRGGLNDERGNLTLKFVELAHELAANNGLRNAVWENVVGVLSDKGNAFGCFLAGLVGANAPIQPPGRWTSAGMVSGPRGRAAWRVLDAQYFGVAQRRRRVLVVADFGNGADPAKVLLIEQGLPRHPPARGEARKDIAPTISALTKGGGGLGTDFDLDGGLVQASQLMLAKGNSSHDATKETYIPEIARCVATREGSSQDYETTTMVAVAGTLCKDSFSGGMGGRPEGATAGHFVAHAIQAGALRTNPSSGPDGIGVQEGVAYTLEARAEVQAVCVTGEVAHTLKAEGADASEDGTGRGTPIIAFTAKDYGADAQEEICPTLRSGNHSGSHANGGVMPTIAFQAEMSVPQVDFELSQTLQATNHQAAVKGSAVRRLTPVECERLQGFPDGYTDIPWRGKPTSPDGPRYKALGNSWAVPKFVWLGQRIARFMPANDNQETPIANAA